MKVIFLDVDGVINCQYTTQSYGGFIGIDPYMAILVDRILQATGAKIVLSSTWRLDKNSRDEVSKFVDFIDFTPDIAHEVRWKEVSQYLSTHQDIEKFAVLDDNWYDFPEDAEWFFKTSWLSGITDEVANKAIEYLNK